MRFCSHPRILYQLKIVLRIFVYCSKNQVDLDGIPKQEETTSSRVTLSYLSDYLEKCFSLKQPRRKNF